MYSRHKTNWKQELWKEDKESWQKLFVLVAVIMDAGQLVKLERYKQNQYLAC